MPLRLLMGLVCFVLTGCASVPPVDDGLAEEIDALTTAYVSEDPRAVAEFWPERVFEVALEKGAPSVSLAKAVATEVIAQQFSGVEIDTFTVDLNNELGLGAPANYRFFSLQSEVNYPGRGRQLNAGTLMVVQTDDERRFLPLFEAAQIDGLFEAFPELSGIVLPEPTFTQLSRETE